MLDELAKDVERERKKVSSKVNFSLTVLCSYTYSCLFKSSQKFGYVILYWIHIITLHISFDKGNWSQILVEFNAKTKRAN